MSTTDAIGIGDFVEAQLVECVPDPPVPPPPPPVVPDPVPPTDMTRDATITTTGPQPPPVEDR